jgi:DNA-binding response OmpR family regulator
MKREGFEVAVAMDGEAALRSVEEKTPDLVLLDIMMPKKNGFEVCQDDPRRIRVQARQDRDAHRQGA